MIFGESVEPRFSDDIETSETKARADAHNDPQDGRIKQARDDCRCAEQRGERGVNANVADLFECA